MGDVGTTPPELKQPNDSNGRSNGSTNAEMEEVPCFALPFDIKRLLKQDRAVPWAKDEDYFQAVIACESSRFTAFQLKSNIASSTFAVNSKLFAANDGGSSTRLMSGVHLSKLMDHLTNDLDAIREDKLAAGMQQEDPLPLLEQFLGAMKATDAEKKVFRSAVAASSGIQLAPSIGGRHDPLISVYHFTNMTVLREVFEDEVSLNDLMKLSGAKSKWVQEKLYERTSSPTDSFCKMPRAVVLAFMGLDLTLTQYRELESSTLQKVLRDHPWFQATKTGKAVIRQEQKKPEKSATTRSEDGSVAAPPTPGPLLKALADTEPNDPSTETLQLQQPKTRDRIFKALSSVTASEFLTGTSDTMNTMSKKRKAEELTSSGDASPPTREDDDFGPYQSELEYLEDQVRLMKTEVALNSNKVAIENITLEDEFRSSSRRDPYDDGYDRYGRPKKTKEDKMLEMERQVKKMETKLEKLQEKINTRLLATQKERSCTPRLEQLCAALHLEKVEKFVIVDLVMSVIMPGISSRDTWGRLGHVVGSLIGKFATSLHDRMNCRRYFYKSGTLIKEGILTVTQQDFMTDLTECKVSLDRRMFDFIVGLDTEFSELVDGSHLYNPTVSLDDVVLNEDTKKRVCDCVMSFDRVKDEYQRMEISDKISYGLGHVLLFYGASGTGKTMLANAVATQLKKKVLLVNFPSLGSNSSGAIIKFMFREARINNALLFFDECESIFRTRNKGDSSVNMILSELEQFEDLCILCTNRPAELDEAMHRRITLAVEFQKPDHILREKIWKQLHPPKLALDDSIDFGELARKFTLTGGLIKNAWLLALGLMVQRGGDKVTQEDLIKASKEQVLGTLSLEEFDLRVVPTRGIDAVIVSDSLKESLSNIVQHTKAQSVLFGQWGFGKLHRAPEGISALFCGKPGTGKSMAAEAIGFDLGMPLKVVNMAALLSKWVGETGKNIQSVFDDAKKKNAVLVFEEAEGLFGKRNSGGTTSSRHDNVNVGLLLQNIENFAGVCIVVTNLKDAIDEAFFRRFQFILNFEPPTAKLRAQLWKSIVPRDCPLAPDVSLDDLANKYDMCGGNIKSALFRAASRAALRVQAKDRVVQMGDLEDACAEEMSKTDGERAHPEMYA